VIYLQALIDTQANLQKYVKDFKFNLGFSGKFFHHGTSEENEGDDALMGKLVSSDDSSKFLLLHCFSVSHVYQQSS